MYYTFITSNPRRSVLYTGLTKNIMERMEQLWNDKGSEKSFAGKYYCYELLFYEKFKFYKDALDRKAEIRKMNRKEKLDLIRRKNPGMRRFKLR